MTQIVLAWDKSELTRADIHLLNRILPQIGMVKVGLEAMTANFGAGSVATAVRDIAKAHGTRVLWDMKLHDIPNTVMKTLDNLSGKVDAVTIHASNGRLALADVMNHVNLFDKELILFAVTVLTSMSDDGSREVYGGDAQSTVLNFADDARATGIPGIVCSGKELHTLRRHALKKLVPGIRPAWASSDDQARITTPAEAVQLGADYIVVGRPILGHPDPLEAIRLIKEEMANARES